MNKFFLILFFFYPYMLFAQTAKITGNIINTQGEAIELATVVVQDSVGKVVCGAVSDSLGYFSLDVRTLDGEVLMVSCIGYETSMISLFSDSTPICITLQPSSTELRNVTVTAKTPLFHREIDRLVFNAEKLNTTATNFMDVLKHTPGILVQDDNISMINKGEILFLMNGRELKMDNKSLVLYLNSLPSERLKQIEVMTTPPAKYSAEGDAGVINFVTKKKLGSFLCANVANRISIKEHVYDGANIGLQYKCGGFETHLNIGVGMGTIQTSSRNYVYYPDDTWKTSQTRLKSNDYVLGTWGLDYTLSGKSAIGFIVSYNNMQPDADTKAATDVVVGIKDVVNTKYFETSTNFDSYYNRHNENIHYTLDSIGKGGKLEVNLDYLNYSINDRANLQSYYDETLNYLNKTRTKIDVFQIKADMEMPVGRTSLEYGTAYSLSKTNNHTDYDYISTGNDLNDHFIYREYILSAYVDARCKISDKWETKIGLRGEYGNFIGESVIMDTRTKKKQFDLFPTMYLSYALNDRSTISISLSGRIKRPNYVDINPFTTYTDAHTTQLGNPNLLPEKSYSWYVDYTFGNFALSASMNWRNRVIFDYTTVDYSQKLTETYVDNVMKKRMCSLDASFYFDKVSWFDSSINFSLYNIHSEPMSGYNLKNIDHASVFVYMNNNFYFDKKRNLMLNAWGQYQSKEKDVTGESASRYRIDMGLKCFLFGRKLSIGLDYQNLLSSHFKTIVKCGESSYKIDMRPYRVFNFSISYQIGKQINTRHKKAAIDTTRL